MSPSRCRLCAKELAEKAGRLDIINYRRVELIRCGGCGSFYAEPLPCEEEMRRIYPDEYYYSENSQVGFSHYIKGALAHLRDGRHFARKLKRIRPQGRFLDYGCGTGFFLLGIKEGSGWETFGVEMAELTVKFANEVLGVPVKRARMSRIDYQDGFFDYIYCNQVLEHLPDPLSILGEFFRILKKGGILFLGVPNGLCDVKPVLNANRRGAVPRTGQPHLFYFNPASLPAFLSGSGFTVNRIYTRGVRAGLADLGILPRHLLRRIFKKKERRKETAAEPPETRDSVRRETEMNYAYYKSRVQELITDKSFRSSRLYAFYRNFKKNLLRLPVRFPWGHCLEVTAVKNEKEVR